MKSLLTRVVSSASLSARRAWIEMSTRSHPRRPKAVALRKESVDRNFNTMQIVVVVVVALRKESVDRNCELPSSAGEFLVALRKESVDRNVNRLKTPCVRLCRSPQGERG